MDFSLNEVQEMLADSIDKFIDNEYAFDTRQKYAASDAGFSADVWSTFAELGWTAVPFAEDDGGFNGDQIDIMVMMQRFGRGLLVEPYLANIVLAGGILKRVGNAAQKQKWLQPIMAGELQASLAFTEPQARYDIANIATTASADGTEWILNGQKGVVFNGGTSDLIIVPARTSGKQNDRERNHAVCGADRYGRHVAKCLPHRRRPACSRTDSEGRSRQRRRRAWRHRRRLRSAG